MVARLVLISVDKIGIRSFFTPILLMNSFEDMPSGGMSAATSSAVEIRGLVPGSGELGRGRGWRGVALIDSLDGYSAWYYV